MCSHSVESVQTAYTCGMTPNETPDLNLWEADFMGRGVPFFTHQLPQVVNTVVVKMSFKEAELISQLNPKTYNIYFSYSDGKLLFTNY